MLNINGEEWRILLVSPTHPSLKRSNGSYTIGSCDDSLKTIFLNDTLEMEYMIKVLCHEIVHAVMFSYNVYLDYYWEEIMADLIATYGQEIISLTNRVMHKIEKRGA